MRAVLFALVLAGCATAPQFRPPASVEVDKIVAVKCVTAMPIRPDYRTEKLTPQATDIDYGDALAIDWVLSRGYEKLLEAGLLACK